MTNTRTTGQNHRTNASDTGQMSDLARFLFLATCINTMTLTALIVFLVSAYLDR